MARVCGAKTVAPIPRRKKSYLEEKEELEKVQFVKLRVWLPSPPRREGRGCASGTRRKTRRPEGEDVMPSVRLCCRFAPEIVRVSFLKCCSPWKTRFGLKRLPFARLWRPLRVEVEMLLGICWISHPQRVVKIWCWLDVLFVIYGYVWRNGPLSLTS